MRLEIPLHIVPCACISKQNMEALVDLPRILSLEEEEAYNKTTEIPNMDLITQIHNGSGKVWELAANFLVFAPRHFKPELFSSSQ